ncbi:MAG: OmpH family outer membrane protein [Sedimentisphaerales bacterium]|nr:OmpH family outer membrane protein [Sedimentisphaerales bacterium]
MKFKTTVLFCLAGAVILTTGYEYLQAQPNRAGSSFKVGVISVQRALGNCQATSKFKEKFMAERDQMSEEEKKITQEGQALADSLTAYKPGSSDHMERLKEMLQKQNELKTLQELNPRRMRLKQMQWTQDLYQEILKIAKELGAKKGLDLVLEGDQPQSPFQSYEELVGVISTHKVLYSEGCVDLTNEVIAELDKIQSKFKY